MFIVYLYNRRFNKSFILSLYSSYFLLIYTHVANNVQYCITVHTFFTYHCRYTSYQVLARQGDAIISGVVTNNMKLKLSKISVLHHY